MSSVRRKLSELIEKPQSGEWGKDDETGRGIPVIRTANFTDGGVINYTNIVTRDIPKEKVEKKGLKTGDIVIEKSGGSDTKPVGRVVFYDGPDDKYLFNNFTAVLRVKDVDLIKPKYLFYYLFDFYWKKGTLQFENKTTGLHNLKLQQMIDSVEIPIKSIEEQNLIVETIEKVESIISQKKEQLDKLDELIKSRFVELFGDPVNNSKGLPELTLPELGEFGRGVSKHRPRNDPKLLGGKYPLIQTGEVANAELYITNFENTYSELGLKQSKMWQAGTLCITIAANIAKTAILTFDACFPDSVVGFKANDKTNNIFIHYWFSFFQAILEAQAPESAQKNINLKILSELRIIVPPIEQQNEFVAFVEQTDKSKLIIQKGIQELDLLKNSLMQEYFG